MIHCLLVPWLWLRDIDCHVDLQKNNSKVLLIDKKSPAYLKHLTVMPGADPTRGDSCCTLFQEQTPPIELLEVCPNKIPYPLSLACRSFAYRQRYTVLAVSAAVLFSKKIEKEFGQNSHWTLLRREASGNASRPSQRRKSWSDVMACGFVNASHRSENFRRTAWRPP